MDFIILIISILIYLYYCNIYTEKYKYFENELNDLITKNLIYFKSWNISSNNLNKIKIRNINQDISKDFKFDFFKFSDIEIIIDNNYQKLIVMLEKKPIIKLNFDGNNKNNGFSIEYINKKLTPEHLYEISLLVKIINYNLLIDKQTSKTYDNLLEYKNIINKLSKNKYLISE